jgi:3-phosphoshikimate 1-carboxyvinyltransferase
MDLTIYPGKLRGEITVIPSKSQAHRLLICAAFADKSTTIICPETNRDIQATVQCLNACGASILSTANGFTVTPAQEIPAQAVLPCQDSGSTLRFLLPVVAALGIHAVFQMTGRLPQRPLSPLWEELERHGCKLTRPSTDTLRCQGKLEPGVYSIDGGVSSQFITGLLLGLSLLDGESQLKTTGKLESKPYIDLTKAAMAVFGADPEHPGRHPFRSPGEVTVEGDWSNGAFWLTAKSLGSELNIHGLHANSAQGDRVVTSLLSMLQAKKATISVSDIPDLVPILSVYAACNHGAIFTDIQRLRLKESDRVASTIAMLEALGGKAEADESTLTVFGSGLLGGTVDAVNDHRIAMAAAIAATVCSQPVTVLGAECVEKSYPRFWEEYHRLGGKL